MSVVKHQPLRRIFTLHLPMLAIVLFALGPYLWMLLTSLKQESTLFSPERTFLPTVVTLENYLRLFQKTTFLSNLGHSLIVSSGTMLLGLSVSITAAYAFSRFRFAGRRALMLQFLLVNMFPIVLLIIPLFIIMKSLGLLDTHLGLILAHSTFSIPFATWMMISYFDAIPRSLDEAAMVDGCTPIGAMFRVVIPLTVPGIIATGIYIFITSWNEYLYASILAGQNVRTLTVAIQTLVGEYEIAWGLLTSGGVVGALPVTLLFMLIQKRLVAGMTQGAVKG
ncbi:carbohydrate ABC transporter membrane protein 2, CUT1 family (TC 3.A.1.1.-) [Rhodoferax sp. OV413]|uniref:carbohydrate ABC transporter permease n=1 Tax=Rhodoferax sp. OV413 TaxID=1855285 RepID=UPI00088A24FB|nr:carbohydrate ABC transporter permease [Rhodoferax sp. OV413]SDP88499.1 carbohydrate ABC transporter membrane protein 2, CUT1 family (TC 3.A.1.1.-) [Rhodoferax sp. OV413]